MTPARRPGALLVAVLLVVASANDVATQSQVPSFRSSVDLVSLSVTVNEGATARLVGGLEEHDFSVYEDGVKQDITLFTGTNLPIALALLLDTSASMDIKLPTVQEAAAGFARRLRPQDLGEIISFDSRVNVVQTFTNDTAVLETGIRRTSTGGSTSLYNAIYVALKELKKTVVRNPDEVRRQAIVLLSDGSDTSSLLGFDEILDLAKRSDTAIYTINLAGTDSSPTAKGFSEAAFVMRQLALETGGRSFSPAQVSELGGVYSQIADELSSQYTVGYTSKNTRRDGTWRRVVVRVDRPNTTVRTKQGYFAPTNPKPIS